MEAENHVLPIIDPWNDKGDEEDSKVIINVGGRRFVTLQSTLKRIPNTRLYSLKPGEGSHFDSVNGEFYFDRNPAVFKCVLEYYRTGELHAHVSLCGPQVKRELKYWGIDQRDIELCCWDNYYGSSETRESLRKFEKALEKKRIVKGTGCRACMGRAWLFLDNPKSSVGARMYCIFSQLVIIISVFTLILESVPEIKVPWNTYDNETVFHIPGIRRPSDTTVPVIEFMYIDNAIYIFFILEYVVRFIVCPKKKLFVIKLYFIFDFLAIIFPIIDYLTYAIDRDFANRSDFTTTMRALESFRVLRLLHIMRYVRAGEVVIYSIRKSIAEICLSILLFIIGILCCGCLMYYAERDNPNFFLTIPISMWWALVTLTTVGYGDSYPIASWGYVVASMTMVLGILLVGLTFSTIVNNYMLYAAHEPVTDTDSCPRSYIPPGCHMSDGVYNGSIYRKEALKPGKVYSIEVPPTNGIDNTSL